MRRYAPAPLAASAAAACWHCSLSLRSNVRATVPAWVLPVGMLGACWPLENGLGQVQACMSSPPPLTVCETSKIGLFKALGRWCARLLRNTRSALGDLHLLLPAWLAQHGCANFHSPLAAMQCLWRMALLSALHLSMCPFPRRQHPSRSCPHPLTLRAVRYRLSGSMNSSDRLCCASRLHLRSWHDHPGWAARMPCIRHGGNRGSLHNSLPDDACRS